MFLLFSYFLSFTFAVGDKCFVGDKEVPCPDKPDNFKSLNISSEGYVIGKISEGPWNKDLLPDNFMSDDRNDLLFYSLFLSSIGLFLFLYISKTKIFGKNIIDYLYPSRWYVLGCVLIVISQYTIVGALADYFPLAFNISQWAWQLLVVLSVYNLVMNGKGNIYNVFVLALLYTFIIHGLKISIRYLFYGRTIFYILDRFLYGGLLVFAVVVPLGLCFLYIRNNNMNIFGVKRVKKR